MSAGITRLTLCMAMLAAVWLGVLPWYARRPRVERQWRELQQSGIDPSAMYYTELEMMGPLLDRLNAPSRQQAE